MSALAEPPVAGTSRPYTAARAPRRDKPVSLLLAVGLHAAFLAAAGAAFLNPPEFAIDKGVNSIEVSLVAAPSKAVPPPAPAAFAKPRPVEPAPVNKPEDVVQPPNPDTPQLVVPPAVPKILAPVPQPLSPRTESRTSGKDDMTVQSAGGATSEAKPDYLKNPAPPYPEAARRRGFQGTVLLTVNVGKDGIPAGVRIEKSSGHGLLDEAAARAVRKWKFRPGMLGDMPVASTVRIPVTFSLTQ